MKGLIDIAIERYKGKVEKIKEYLDNKGITITIDALKRRIKNRRNYGKKEI